MKAGPASFGLTVAGSLYASHWRYCQQKTGGRSSPPQANFDALCSMFCTYRASNTHQSPSAHLSSGPKRRASTPPHDQSIREHPVDRATQKRDPEVICRKVTEVGYRAGRLLQCAPHVPCEELAARRILDEFSALMSLDVPRFLRWENDESLGPQSHGETVCNPTTTTRAGQHSAGADPNRLVFECQAGPRPANTSSAPRPNMLGAQALPEESAAASW